MIKSKFSLEIGLKYFQITIGSILFACGIENFLKPNGIIDGGVAGISIMINEMLHIPVWVPFAVLNFLTLLFTFKALGKEFMVRTIFANIVATLSLHFFSGYGAITHSELLTVGFGGALVGIGVALVIKNSGAIDGTEMIATRVKKQFHVPISKFLLIVNIFIFSIATFVFSLEHAMFSVATFIVATKLIDFVLDGFNQGKSIRIIARRPKEIGDALIKELDISITYLTGVGGYSGESQELIYCMVDKRIYPKLKEITLEIEPTAIIEANQVTESTGVANERKLKIS